MHGVASRAGEIEMFLQTCRKRQMMIGAGLWLTDLLFVRCSGQSRAAGPRRAVA